MYVIAGTIRATDGNWRHHSMARTLRDIRACGSKKASARAASASTYWMPRLPSGR
jgi:hypothetical protein